MPEDSPGPGKPERTACFSHGAGICLGAQTEKERQYGPISMNIGSQVLMGNWVAARRCRRRSMEGHSPLEAGQYPAGQTRQEAAAHDGMKNLVALY